MESAFFAIRQFLPELPQAELKVAEFVLAEPRKVIHYNITELARQSGVSQAAVVRFCRRIGMDSFSDFKLRLSHDVFRTSDERFLPDFELESDMNPVLIVEGLIGSIQRSLAQLEALVDIHTLEKIVDAIQSARINHIFGIGASNLVAQDMYQKLIRIGLPCSASQDTDLQITAACNLHAEDVAFIISYSGESPAMIRVAEWARKKGSTIITLTMETGNSIRKYADLALTVPAQERVYRPGATVSRLSQLAVIDIVFSILISKNLNKIIMSIEETMEATHVMKRDIGE